MTVSTMTFRNNTISISTNTTTYTDISSWANEIKVDGGERAVAEEYVFGTDTALTAAGKRAPLGIEVTLIYTEVATDPFELFVRPAYETSTPTPVYLKWSPKGAETATTGEFVYATDALHVTTPPYPQGNAKADEIVKFSLKGTTSFITKSTSAT